MTFVYLASISNASDALDKLRFLSVMEPQLIKDNVDLDIRIQTDKDNGIITITYVSLEGFLCWTSNLQCLLLYSLYLNLLWFPSPPPRGIYSDTGIGMTRQELVDCLGTIAQSGTAKFLKALKVCCCKGL